MLFKSLFSLIIKKECIILVWTPQVSSPEIEESGILNAFLKFTPDKILQHYAKSIRQIGEWMMMMMMMMMMIIIIILIIIIIIIFRQLVSYKYIFF